MRLESRHLMPSALSGIFLVCILLICSSSASASGDIVVTHIRVPGYGGRVITANEEVTLYVGVETETRWRAQLATCDSLRFPLKLAADRSFAVLLLRSEVLATDTPKANEIPFSYRVQYGDYAERLTADTSPEAMDLFSKSVADCLDQPGATVSWLLSEPGHLEEGGPAVSIDADPPRMLSLCALEDDSSAGGEGVANVGDTVDILATFNQPVFFFPPSDSSDPPCLKLNTGGCAHVYGTLPDPSQPSERLLLSYRVSSGDWPMDTLEVFTSSEEGFHLGSARLVDPHTGLPVDLSSLPSPPNPGSLSLCRPVTVSTPLAPIPHPQALLYPHPHPQRLQGMGMVTPRRSSDSGHLIHRRPSLMAETSVPPTEVSLRAQLSSLLSVDEKSQSFRVDVTLIQQWKDDRFQDATLPAVTLNDSTALASIWYPQLTFTNAREKPVSMDERIFIYNTGTIELWQRFLITLSSRINVKDFPFDTQLLSIEVASSQYSGQQLLFTCPQDSSDPQTAASYPGLSSQTDNPGWWLSGFGAVVTVAKNGWATGFSTVMFQVNAHRRRTFNTVFVLLPLSLLTFIALVTFAFPIKSPLRVSTVLQALAGMLLYSVAVAALSPPVTQMTRMTWFVLQTFLYILTAGIVQLFIVNVIAAQKEVRKELKMEKVKNDRKQLESWREEVDKAVSRIQATQTSTTTTTSSSSTSTSTAASAPAVASVAAVSPPPIPRAVLTDIPAPVIPSSIPRSSAQPLPAAAVAALSEDHDDDAIVPPPPPPPAPPAGLSETKEKKEKNDKKKSSEPAGVATELIEPSSSSSSDGLLGSSAVSSDAVELKDADSSPSVAVAQRTDSTAPGTATATTTTTSEATTKKAGAAAGKLGQKRASLFGGAESVTSAVKSHTFCCRMLTLNRHNVDTAWTKFLWKLNNGVALVLLAAFTLFTPIILFA